MSREGAYPATEYDAGGGVTREGTSPAAPILRLGTSPASACDAGGDAHSILKSHSILKIHESLDILDAFTDENISVVLRCGIEKL